MHYLSWKQGPGRQSGVAAETNREPISFVRLWCLHDRYGDEIGPFLAKGHPLQSGKPASSLTSQQIGDLANFLHRQVYYTLRGGPDLEIKNVLTGDPKAGEAYFNGAGKCNTCHSPTRDLAGIGKKYDPPTLQTRFLFPRTVAFGRAGSGTSKAKPVTVTVTLASGEVVEGVLDKLDDFNVSLRDAQGEYRSFAITPAVKVVKNDPYAGPRRVARSIHRQKHARHRRLPGDIEMNAVEHLAYCALCSPRTSSAKRWNLRS